MNNYETFKDELVLALRENSIPDDEVNKIICIVGEVAQQYNVERLETGLTLYGGVSPLVKMFLASKAVEGKSKGTIDNYYFTLTNFFKYACKPPQEITANDVRVYFYNYQRNRNVKACTMESMRHCFNSFFGWCFAEEYIPKNPMLRVQAFRVEESKRTFMTPIELEYIREACADAREKAIVDFLFSTGCRVTELCNVRMEDVDLKNRTVFIRNGKGGKSRTTYLNAEAIVSLTAYLNTRKYDGTYLFCSTRRRVDKPLNKKTIEMLLRKIMSRLREKTGKHITPHVFRHTAATTALRNGMPVEQVRAFMGHANLNTTMIYAKVDNNDVQRSHEKFLG